MEFKSEYLGRPFMGEESEEERRRRVQKAQDHERSFGKKQDSDIIKKRMDSDLFKGGLR
jgi:hypothetical protein